MNRQAFIIDALRSPFGRYGGALASVRPDDLASQVIKALIQRNPQIDPSLIDDVILGCANQSGEDNRNIARMSSLLADLPVTVPGATVNRLCGSGLMAVNMACQAILANEGDIFIAGGVESMSRAPFVMAKSDEAFKRGDNILYDTTIGWRFINPKLAQMYYPYTMGETAENVAQKYNISRSEQDEFALFSQQKYALAKSNNHFTNEIIPITVVKKKQSLIVDNDEHPRLDCKIEDLTRLKPAFRENGSVTAGNASGINDGACVLLVVSAEVVAKYNLKPLAKFVASSVAGVDPSIMGIGPVTATQKCLKKANLNISDLNVIELNEAFAAQSLACIQELKLNPKIVNVNGGAIAVGHPLGASGARILSTLVYQMVRNDYNFGLASMCIGVGQGIATVISKV